MIKLIEVYTAIIEINESFQNKTAAKLRNQLVGLQNRLASELTSRSGEFNDILIELKTRLGTYLNETDLSTPEAGELFDNEIAEPFALDLERTEFKKFIDLAKKIRRLQWR